MFSHVELTEQLVLNSELADERKGLRNYRVEYYGNREDGFADFEVSIWLPENLPCWELELLINNAFKRNAPAS